MFHNLIVTAKVPVGWLAQQYGGDFEETPGLPEGVRVEDGFVTFDFVLSGACDGDTGEVAMHALEHAFATGTVTHSVDS